MNDNLKIAVAALEGDEYKQGTKYLTQVLPDGTELDCCLGVMCKVAIKLGLELKVDTINNSYDGVPHAHKTYNCESSTLPPKVMDFYGIVNDCGTFYYNESEYTALTKLNDKGRTFKEIAEIIKSEPKYLLRK